MSRKPTPAEAAAAKKVKNPVTWGSRRAARRKTIHPRNVLCAIREGLGLTQRDVSSGSGVNNATVADAEAGFEVSLTTAIKLAAFFGKPIEELWKPR